MIGDILRREREKQNLTVQDIEKETSIRALYIEALEQGEYDKLPGEVYAKGFIKNYANFLELDGDDMVKKFVMEISPTTIAPEETKPAEKSDAKVAAETPAENLTITKTRAQKRAESKADSEDDKKKYLVAAAAALILLIGGLIFAFSGGEENSVAQQEPAQTEQQQIAQVKPTPEPVPTPVPVSGVSVQATFSGDCWAQVIIDSVQVFEGMINAGQAFDWSGTQSVYVVLGNAGAGNFVVNGQDIGALGSDGAVVERTFTR